MLLGMRLGKREIIIAKNNETAVALIYVENWNFPLAVFSTPHLQVVGHVLAAKANSLAFLQSSCLVMASMGLSNCVFLYTCFYFPH